jgi:hypothetical protein
MRQTHTNLPGLVVREIGPSRVIYFAADIDRRYANDNLSDHGDLLANAARWAAGDGIPLQVEGPGLIDCRLYQQPGRLILHIVNLTSAGTWRAPMDELTTIGPLRISIKLPPQFAAKNIKTLVAGDGRPSAISVADGWAKLDLKAVTDHEVTVIES